MSPIIYQRKCCRACGGHDLSLVFCLKPTPLGDAYVDVTKLDISQPSYPIDLYSCANCGLAQLLSVINRRALYKNFVYATADTMGLASHFRRYANDLMGRFRLPAGALVVDLGKVDGTLLKYFRSEGMKVLGVEPIESIAKYAISNEIDIINSCLNINLAKQIVKQYGYAKLVTANNFIANIDELIPWVSAVKELLAEDGVFVFESSYLPDLVQNLVFDFIYHEHLSALSVRPMKILFERIGLQLINVERVSTKGGSLRYFVQRSKGPLRDDGSVLTLLKYEYDIDLYGREIFAEFKCRVDILKEQLHSFLQPIRDEGGSIAGFGASVTGTTLIYHFELSKYLDYLVDDNVEKQGLFSPGLHLEVMAPSVLQYQMPDYVVLLAWRFADSIIKKHQNYLNAGGCFLVPAPQFQVIRKNLCI